MRARQIHNVGYLKETRRALRKELTAAEAVLWTCVKNSQVEGRRFRRQHSIGNYIVDFYCASAKLIIELDGSVHDNPGQASADFDRDAHLRELGYKVLRFQNELIFHHLEEVLDIIKANFDRP